MASNLTMWMSGFYIFEKIQNKIEIFNLTHLWKLSTKSTKFWPSIMFVKVLLFSSNHGFHQASFTVSWALHLQLPWALKAPNIPSEIHHSTHKHMHREPKEAGRCGTLLVGRAEPIWTSPWRSKVVSGTLLRWRETQKKGGGGLIISADDKEVNRISGQTNRHTI